MPTLFPTDALDGLIRTGGSCRVNVNVEPGFAPGDKVMAININPRTHTRLPTYVRGKRGIVMRDHGAFVFPDTNAQLKGEKPQHVYSVMFEAGELWGDAEFPGDKVLIDMFEDYLRPANGKGWRRIRPPSRRRGSLAIARVRCFGSLGRLRPSPWSSSFMRAAISTGRSG
jgi:nitrile hydratase